jgi:ribonucleoside-triphosphate reductase
MGESWEATLIQKAILQVRIDGLGKDKTTAIFPKLVFGIKDGLNHKPSDPNYEVKELALECASKRMYPDVLNYDKTVEITGGYKAPMGCRSFLAYHEDESGKEFYAGRNNLGVVSLNLPKYAVEAQGNMTRFLEILDSNIWIAHKALQYRLERLSTVQAKSAPIMYMEGALGLRLAPEEYVLPHLLERGASISMGYIGLEEAANAMFGTDTHILDSKEKQTFALGILKILASKAAFWKKEENIGYSIYATPSESLCNRFCKAIVQTHGEIAGVTDKGYLTNSFHLDVLKETDPYSKAEFEAQFIPYSSGGHISYAEQPSLITNPKALEMLWDFSYGVTPYYAVNMPIDKCFECGFEGEFTCSSEGFVCPSCGNSNPEKCSVTRRVCGYLGNPGTRPFNEGKQSEMTKRVKHGSTNG